VNLYPKRLQGVSGKLAASLMLLLWVGLLLAAGSPEIHRLVHKDSQSADHHCAVTAVQQHQTLTSLGGIAVPALTLNLAFAAPISQSQFSSAPNCRLYPSRAPPSSPSFATVAG
jgi:hypothetical protein